MMKPRWIIALLVALVCMAAPAMALEPSTPFAISGHIFDADGNPCNDPWVRITNLNTSVSWDAGNSSTSNYYQLALDSDDVSVDNVLSIEASGCSQSKTVEHTVTQDEISDGGFFSEDITLEAMTTYYGDADGDGYGDPANTTEASSAPAGYVTDNTDCDDANAAVNPGAAEVCDDLIDNDCDGLIDCNDPDCPPCPKPDLAITEKSEKSETLNGSVFTVTYTVANIGGDNAGASTTCIYVDGTHVANDPVGVLAAGATYGGTVVIDPFDCPCGTAVTVTVRADNDDVVDESDETNNCLNNTFDCPPCPNPDLVITDIRTELKRVGKNVNTTIIWYNITNKGATTAGRSNSNLTVDGVVQKRTDGVGKLAPWETRTEKFTYRGDPHNITVCADCKNRVAESNETNNCLSVTV